MPTEANVQVMTLLAKEWDMKGPPGIMDVSDIGVERAVCEWFDRYERVEKQRISNS